MKLLVMMMTFLIAFSAFAGGLKEIMIEDYQREVSLSRENLVQELENKRMSEVKKNRKLRQFDKKAMEGLNSLQKMSEQEVMAMKDSQNEKSCLFEPGYMFFITKMTVEDIKHNQQNESKAIKRFNKFVGVPIAVGVDVIILPFTVLMGFAGPKYCD